MKNKILIIIIIILSFIIGGLLTYIVFVDNDKQDKKTNTPTNYNSCSNCMSGTMIVENGGIKETVKKVYDAVVMVKNYQDQVENKTGSGFIYKKNDKYGYIITNQHVIDDATSISVVIANGEEVSAELVGKDKYLDVAILRIPSEKVIAVAKIGSSEKIELGETVAVIGTPVNKEYYNTVTGGYISGLNRRVMATVYSTDDWMQDVIQVDAPINLGSSGGPLVNTNGEVIGIITLKFIDANIEGMGFAIKIDDVMSHISELEKGKTIGRPFIGITYTNIGDSVTLSKYNITLNSYARHGVVVLDITKNSAAEKSGIQAGDIIIKIDNEEIKNVAHLKYLLYKHNVGDKINLTVLRNNKEISMEVTVTNTKEN